MTTKTSRGAYCLEFTCSLQFAAPVHVGSGQRLSPYTDAPILLDPAGGEWLPGTSVRGVIRDWCEREACLLGITDDVIKMLFGPHQHDTGDNDFDRQGRLTVYDIAIKERSRPQIRDHVRFDEQHGAAQKGGKFDSEIAWIKSGVLRFVYQGDGSADPQVLLLKSFTDALSDGVISFGAKQGSGYGSVKVTRSSWRQIRRCNTAELTQYLRHRLGNNGGSPWTDITTTISQLKTSTARASAVSTGVAPPLSWIAMDIEIAFDGPALTVGVFGGRLTDKTDERDADATYAVDSAGAPVFPGSALRGAARARAFRIARSLDDLRKDSSAQCRRIADLLFGTTKKRGLVSFGDGTVEIESSTEVRALNHVAIDRVTGFAASGRLFSAAALSSPVFNSRILLRWNDGDEDHQAALALLLLTLRDIDEGWVGLGSRTTRGYGHVKTYRLAEMRISTVNSSGRIPTQRIQNVTLASLADQCNAVHVALTVWSKILTEAS